VAHQSLQKRVVSTVSGSINPYPKNSDGENKYEGGSEVMILPAYGKSEAASPAVR